MASTTHWVAFALWCRDGAETRQAASLHRFDGSIFFVGHRRLNSSIVIVVRAPLSGGSVELIFVSSRVRCVANLLTSLFSTQSKPTPFGFTSYVGRVLLDQKRRFHEIDLQIRICRRSGHEYVYPSADSGCRRGCTRQLHPHSRSALAKVCPGPGRLHLLH